MSKKVKTHYDNLQVVRNASPEVIRAAYKSLSQKYHPDRNQDKPDAARIMSLINTAYDVLSNPVKRRQHDAWIESQEIIEPTHSDTARRPSHAHSSFKYQLPKAGSCSLADLSPESKERLISRIRGTSKQQFAVKTEGVLWSYFLGGSSWSVVCIPVSPCDRIQLG